MFVLPCVLPRGSPLDYEFVVVVVFMRICLSVVVVEVIIVVVLVGLVGLVVVVVKVVLAVMVDLFIIC